LQTKEDYIIKNEEVDRDLSDKAIRKNKFNKMIERLNKKYKSVTIESKVAEDGMEGRIYICKYPETNNKKPVPPNIGRRIKAVYTDTFFTFYNYEYDDIEVDLEKQIELGINILDN
jgi:hypothetical protein